MPSSGWNTTSSFLFHVPNTAGGHPRVVLALVAFLILIGIGGAFVMTRAEPHKAEVAVEAPLPERPPLLVVQDLPQLAQRLAREGEAGRFSGGVLVARGDQVLFRQVYGMANHEQGVPLALDSKFRLASVSKQFTAAAILKLQDEGKLTIADPVCQWVQPCPDAWAPIRITHLLSHTSGIPDLMARPQWGLGRVTPITLGKLTEDSKQYGLQFPPGTRVRYNNAGFNLAAAIVEKASGMAFADYMQQALFDPLGMTETGLGDRDDLVMGYANFPGGLTPQPDANVSVVIGAGAMYSTLDDLLIWQRALHGGQVLTPFSYAQMMADHAPADMTPNERGQPRRLYGYGIYTNSLGRRVDPAFEDRQFYHTGSWSGFRNLMVYQPEAGVSVIVLSNNYHQYAPVMLSSQQGLAEALGHPFPTALNR